MTSELLRQSETKLTHKVAVRTRSKTVYFPVTREDFQRLGQMPSSERTGFLLSMAEDPLYDEEIEVREKARLVRVSRGGEIDHYQNEQILSGGISKSYERLKVIAPKGGSITITETTDPDKISHLAAEHAENIQPEGIGAIAAVIPNILAALLPGIFRGLAEENEALTGNPRAPATAKQKAGLEIAGRFDRNRQGAVAWFKNRINGIDYSPPSITAEQAYKQRQREWTEPGGSHTRAVRPSGNFLSIFSKIATITFPSDSPVEPGVIIEAAGTDRTVAEVIHRRDWGREEETAAGITFSLGGKKVSEEEWGRRRG